MLGCGGLDIMVVVFVVVFDVECCDIYIDVDGIYMIDLCISVKVCKLDKIVFEEMFEFVSLGVKVL